MNKKLIIVCLLGNTLEWFEFVVYGYFAPTIGVLFFSFEDPTLSRLFSWALFAAGVAVRPIGGILMGSFGDRFGRKAPLILSISMMALATMGIGLTPTYTSIGIAAPILILCFRLIQGLTLGGEYAGTILILTENVPKNKKGLYGSLTALSLVGGMLLGSIMHFLIHTIFDPVSLQSWGWRIPFIFASLSACIVYILRKKLSETPEYQEIKDHKQFSRKPFKELIQSYGHQLVNVTFAQSLLAAGMYILPIYYLSFSKEYLKLSPNWIAFTNVLSICSIGIAGLLSGKLSTYYSEKKILKFVTLMSIVLAYFCVQLSLTKNLYAHLLGYLLMGIMIGLFIGVTPSFLSKNFPVRIRYTGVAFSNNLVMAIFGGTAPLLITFLTTIFSYHVMAYYFIFCGVISYIFIRRVQYIR